MTRQTKTPAQRAQEAVDVLKRRRTRLITQRQALFDQADDLLEPLEEIDRRLEYAMHNPDLPTDPDTQPQPDNTVEKPA